VLCKAPIGRQRLIEDLEEERAVGTVMPDRDDGLIAMPLDDQPQRVRGPGYEVLQGLATRKANEVRRREPSCEQLWLLGFDLFVGSELPCAIVDIV
jgi:hypothetical protein